MAEGYQPVLTGGLVVCMRCAAEGRTPLIPRWMVGRHDEWHARQAAEDPVLECAS